MPRGRKPIESTDKTAKKAPSTFMPKPVKACEIMTQQEYLTEEKILQVISERACITKYAYILHDKDILDEDDIEEITARRLKAHIIATGISESYNPVEAVPEKVGDLKKPHWHIMLSFDNSRHIKHIAQWFGLDVQFVNRIKADFAHALAYLCHDKYPERFQYEESEVKSNYNWQAEKKFGLLDFDDVCEKIKNGEIKEYNVVDYIGIKNYINKERQLKSAFAYRNRLLLRDPSRNMNVVYIHGGSSAGKTLFAKELARSKGLEFFVTGSSRDSMNYYMGQPCVIFDDVRGDNMKFTDFLKLLDNNTASAVGSRFVDKIMDSELIILTSVKDLDALYESMRDLKEPLLQLYRRCGYVLKMNDDTIEWRKWDKQRKEYLPMQLTKNPREKIIARLESEEATRGSQNLSVAEFIGAGFLNYITDGEGFIPPSSEPVQMTLSEISSMVETSDDLPF